MTDTIQIASFYHGPPDSGHGGYTAGLIAQLVPAETVEVTLRKPPPLDRPLTVERKGDALRVTDGETLIAEAQPSGIDVTADVPVAVAYGDAVVASIDYAGFKSHLTPSCFVCGTAREPNEGLRIFPGPMRRRDVVAAALVPEAHLAGDDGQVKPQFVWAVLDCPSGWAVTEFVPGREAMLGRLTARIVKPLLAGKRYSVIGWRLNTENRKMHSGSAVFDYDGGLCAAARATWIMLSG
ncbi:MAG: hypothetical protein AAB092_00850 [Chloroflexota bacterium]|mgnify:CR=1 FL=1